MKILLLAGNTFRSKAYAQSLKNLNIEPIVLLYGFNEKPLRQLTISEATRRGLESRNLNIPDFKIEVRETFNTKKWPILTCDEVDVNSDTIISLIKESAPDLVIYSGYGGQLLHYKHFELNIPYLHMHPGNIPDERGSTTIYYSILNRRNCTVSAFYMNEEIDAGEIVLRKEYEVPDQTMDIDNFYDNAIRADCMKAAIRIIEQGHHQLEYPNYTNSLEYYVVHPVLKHLSILSLK